MFWGDLSFVKANGWCLKGLTKKCFDMFTGATKYSLPLVLKVGLDNVFERYAERVVCHAIHHQKSYYLFLRCN